MGNLHEIAYKVYAQFTELWVNKDIGPTLLCALLELGKVRKMNFIHTLLSIRLHSPRNLNCALSEKCESWIRVVARCQKSEKVRLESVENFTWNGNGSHEDLVSLTMAKKSIKLILAHHRFHKMFDLYLFLYWTWC